MLGALGHAVPKIEDAVVWLAREVGAIRERGVHLVIFAHVRAVEHRDRCPPDLPPAKFRDPPCPPFADNRRSMGVEGSLGNSGEDRAAVL